MQVFSFWSFWLSFVWRHCWNSSEIQQKHSACWVNDVTSSSKGRDYFAGLRVTKRNKATVLLTLTLLQTPTWTLTLILTVTLT
jgi:hypothetical protein